MIFDPEQITFFAKTDARGEEVPFGIKAKDRTRHVYVIGKTGMGKSTMLENMAVQDIKNGNGLAFIDPHGATAETLLEYIPEERIQDVLYFAPFDTANPISFNVMEDVGPDKRHLVVAGLMSVFKKIWVDAWSARMEYILSNTLLALLEYPDSTLLGVNRMLSDKHYRKKVVENISDPAVKSFWVDEFANYSERYMQEAGDAIKNKIGQFTSNPLIRNIIGQPHSSFDIRTLMDERKIIIANLSKGLVGESNANLLGSMLTTRIYLAAMSRADLTSNELKAMPNFYFYVDEFQSFANATFADILSEARKYKLNLTIAHQYIEQMEEEVRNAVFGNVGTIISFRVGPFDAEVLETVFTPKFTAADIVNLGFAQIYLSLMIDGIGSPPFSAVTLPPIVPPHVSYKEMAIAESRRRFARERQSVEEKINAWHAEDHTPPKPPRNNNGSGGGGAQFGRGNGNHSNSHNNNGRTERANAPDRRTGGSKPSRDPEAQKQQLKDTLRAVAAGAAGGAATATQKTVAETDLPKQTPAPAEKPATETVTAPAPPVAAEQDATPQPNRAHTPRAERPQQPDRQYKDNRREARADRSAQSGSQRDRRSAESRRAEQPAPRQTKRAPDAESLRDVLRTLAKQEADKQPAKDSAAGSAKQTSETPAREDLKAALAGAIGGSIDTFKTQQAQAAAEHQAAIEAERASGATGTQPPARPVSETPAAPASVHEYEPDLENRYAAMKNRKPLSPKQLERMMRVTGSDKNPLR